MANKLVQLSDGTDNIFIQNACVSHASMVTMYASTTNVATLTLPSGFKLLRVNAWYNNGTPLRLMLTDDVRYEKLGHIDNVFDTTTQVLSLTTLTNANTVYVFTKYDNESENVLEYNYILLAN